jgi:lysozyme
MEAPRHIIDYLKTREGWETEVYIDTQGHPTAGMGHLLTESERATYKEGDTIPAQVLARWTRADTAGAYGAAIAQATELGLASDTAFVTVLTSVNYQLGTHWRGKFPQTWSAIKERKWALAAQMVRGSKWATQTPSRAREFADALQALNQGIARAREGGRTGLKIALAGALVLLVATIAAAATDISN